MRSREDIFDVKGNLKYLWDGCNFCSKTKLSDYELRNIEDRIFDNADGDFGQGLLVINEYFTLYRNRTYIERYDYCDEIFIRLKGSKKSKHFKPGYDDDRTFDKAINYLIENNAIDK